MNIKIPTKTRIKPASLKIVGGIALLFLMATLVASAISNIFKLNIMSYLMSTLFLITALFIFSEVSIKAWYKESMRKKLHVHEIINGLSLVVGGIFVMLSIAALPVWASQYVPQSIQTMISGTGIITSIIGFLAIMWVMLTD